MPAYSRKPMLFQCRGMNLNHPVHEIPDNEFAYLQNVRSYMDGRLERRPGVSRLSNNALVGGTYIHSFYTLNDYNPDTPGGGKRFVGIGARLNWGDLSIPTTFSEVDSGFSGNPLSMLSFAPELNPTPFVYVYDSEKQQKFSSSYTLGGSPIAFEIGIPLSAIYQAGPPVPVIAGGAITGTGYYWRWQLRHTLTGARSTGGVPTYSPIDLTAEKAFFADPNIAITGILAQDGLYVWDLYRFGGTISSWKLVGSVQNTSGNSITDNFTDLQLASSLSLATDNASIRYQPWISPDIPRSGVTVFTTAAVDTVSGDGGNGSLVRSNGFNIDWIPGTPILIGGVGYTVARVISPQTLYINEDLEGDLGAVDWSVFGALQAGQPLPYVWGPYGGGITGLYVFGCGDPRASGTLNWTNGNDPDSVSVTGSLEITDPSEPLQNGCVWNGRVYVWSTLRMWEVSPDLAKEGQFVAQVIPGSKGLPYNWCFCVGDYIYWLSEDGVYRFNGSQCESMSDHQLNNLLGHDGNQGTDVFLPNPSDSITPLVVKAPNPNNPTSLRMNWHQGVLHFDYVANNGAVVNLVYDSHIVKGWMLDKFAIAGQVAHYNENGYTDLIVAISNRLYLVGGGVGVGDDNNPIDLKFMTRADLLGDLRAEKIIGDASIGANTNDDPNVIAILLSNFNQSALAAVNLTPSGVYLQSVLTVNSDTVDTATAAQSQTAGLWIQASTTQDMFFFDWEPSYVPKPEITKKRAIDWTEDGEPGNKFVYGCLIEANTFGEDRVVEIRGDNNQLITTLTVNHAIQETKPYAFAIPLISHQLRMIPTDENSWEFFKVTWRWTLKPELTRFIMDWTDDNVVAPKYLQGFVLEGDTNGEDVTIELRADGDQVIQTFTVNHDGQLEKPYAVTDPPVVHEMRLVPVSGSIRYMAPFKIGWVYTKQPEFTAWVEDFTGTDPISFRGVAIEADTEGADVQVQVITENGVMRTLTVNHNGRQQKAYSFLEPFIATEIKLVPLGNWWHSPDWKTRWIGDARPDLAALYTDYSDDGYQGAKFYQGFILWADTQGADRVLTIEYDGGQVGGVFTKVNHSGQLQVPYSFTQPFTAHQVRVIPNGSLRYMGPWKIRWIWEPAPELAKNWITQTTSHGFRGFHHHRDVYVAIQSYANVTLKVILDDGTTHLYLIPSTGGEIRKPYEVLEPMKAKLSQYHLISCKPFRVWQKDCEMRVKEWGSSGDYISQKVFGDLSFERGARI